MIKLNVYDSLPHQHNSLVSLESLPLYCMNDIVVVKWINAFFGYGWSTLAPFMYFCNVMSNKLFFLRHFARATILFQYCCVINTQRENHKKHTPEPWWMYLKWEQMQSFWQLNILSFLATSVFSLEVSNVKVDIDSK